jgi:hypothetical protein
MEKIKIIYFHEGKTPYYLRCSLESARYFNPKADIILITDKLSNLGDLGIKQFLTSNLDSIELQKLITSYKHISGLKYYYELLFIRRWFYLNKLIHLENIQHCVLCDSDFMIFNDVTRIASHLPVANIASSKYGNPCFTLINGAIDGFILDILAKYENKEFLQECQRLSDEASRKGQLNSLGDMVFLKDYISNHQDCAHYPSELEIGHLDYNINAPQGFAFKDIKHRKRERKKVYWKYRNKTYTPHFCRESDKVLVPALGIHYQSGSKRIMRRFNPVSGFQLSWPKLRLAYYNWLHSGFLSEWL